MNCNLEFSGATTSFIQQTLKCVAGDPPDCLSVCHCAFEAHNDLISKQITQYLVKDHAVSFGHPRAAHDCSAILYVIANLQECGYDLNVNFHRGSENQIKELMHILASKKGKLWISELDLSGSRLTVSSLQALQSAVCGDMLAKLKYLDLEGSLTIDADTNAKWLATLLQALLSHCPYLKSLNLSNNNLGVLGAAALTKLYVSGQGQLCLNKINLGDKGLTILVKSLKVISDLGLADNDIHASGVSCLADAVYSGELKIEGELDLRGNPLGLEGTIVVGRMLSSSHCKLTFIYLSRCDLATAGGGPPSTYSISCEAVGRQLCQMPPTSAIAQLDLSHNSFTGDGIHILAGFMHLCPGLLRLHTCDCGITSDDLIWLLDKLKSSTPGLCSMLEHWHLQDNQIDGRGVSALIDHLPVLPCLGCGPYETFNICSFSNNPIVHNSEVMERLEEEPTRHRERNEEELRRRRKRGRSHEEEVHEEATHEEVEKSLRQIGLASMADAVKDDIEKGHTCPICLQVLREPYQATCCGVNFCRECIHQVKAANKPCPMCREGDFHLFPDKRLRRVLYNVRVDCMHKNEGCEWTGELRELDEHLSNAHSGEPPRANSRQTTAKLEGKVDQMMVQPPQPIAGTYTPEVAEFTMDNFDKHKRDKDTWYSPHFYTHPNGYKMCLRVDANGNASGRGTHLSVFVCLVQGEFDDQLKWPFRGDITIKLVDQKKDKDHVIKTFYSSSAGERCARVMTTEVINNGWGIGQFLPHAKLRPKYLKKNCIKFYINKIDLY